jgi:hypothetical protein
MATADTPTNRLSTQTPPTERVRQEETSAEVVAGGSMGEAIGGIAAVVLAIVGLAGVYPGYLAGITAIVVGAGLLLQGGAVAARFSTLLSETAGTRLTNRQLGGGMSAEFLGGAAGIVLGILALIGIYPAILLPVSAIVFGGVLVLACGTMARLNSLAVEQCMPGNATAQRVASEVVATANGAQALVGLAAIVLGIIALVGSYPLSLTLVAFLCVGAAILLSGAAVGTKMISLVHR